MIYNNSALVSLPPPSPPPSPWSTPAMASSLASALEPCESLKANSYNEALNFQVPPLSGGRCTLLHRQQGSCHRNLPLWKWGERNKFSGDEIVQRLRLARLALPPSPTTFFSGASTLSNVTLHFALNLINTIITAVVIIGYHSIVS